MFFSHTKLAGTMFCKWAINDDSIDVGQQGKFWYLVSSSHVVASPTTTAVCMHVQRRTWHGELYCFISQVIRNTSIPSTGKVDSAVNVTRTVLPCANHQQSDRMCMHEWKRYEWIGMCMHGWWAILNSKTRQSSEDHTLHNWTSMSVSSLPN